MLLLSLPCQAQKRARKMVEQKDSTALFRGVAVNVDLMGPVQMLVSDYGVLEASLRVNLKDRYFPIFEVGLGKANSTEESTGLNYKTSAPYARVGCDFNLLRNKHDIYRLYGGARYGLTYYKYDVSGPDLTDPIWGGTAAYGATGVSCNYHWMEVVLGVDAKLWGPVRLGWTLRYKRQLFHKEGDIGNTCYVPGYGKKGGSRFGGTVNLTFELGGWKKNNKESKVTK